MQKQFDLIGIGECLIELYEEAPYIYKQSVAGDVFNTLFYASRLGLQTGFISNFGTDDLTKKIIGLMDKEGIDRTCTLLSESKTNGLYLISTNESGDPKYSFWRNDSAARKTLQSIEAKRLIEYSTSSKYFHFSAIGLAIFREREKLISLLPKINETTTITFDTNFRKGLWEDIGILQDFLAKSSSVIDVLFVSNTDDENIYGKRTADVAMNFFRDLGYKTIIYRQGSDEVITWDGNSILKVPTCRNVPVVDTTAAGDAFNAGFISSQLQGESIERSIIVGSAIAAFVIGREGALADDLRLHNGTLI